MSKQFAESFFPSFTSFLSSPDYAPSFLVHVWNFIFPDDVSTLCSLPSRNTSHVSYIPHRPCLAVAAMIGIVIGLKPREDRKKIYHDGSTRMVLTHSILESWSKSLTTFGSMNVAGLMHHCILPPPSCYQNMNSAREYVDNILWGADCIFTGLSSIQIIIMAGLIYSTYAKKQNSKEVASLKHSIKRWRMLVLVSLLAMAATISMLCQLFFIGSIDLRAASTFIEMTYLLPLQVAAMALLPLFVASAFKSFGIRSKQRIYGSQVAILGGTLVVLGVLLDAPLCHCVSTYAPSIKASPLLYDIYHLPTLVFLGCDISFLGLNTWINALVDELAIENKKEH